MDRPKVNELTSRIDYLEDGYLPNSVLERNNGKVLEGTSTVPNPNNALARSVLARKGLKGDFQFPITNSSGLAPEEAIEACFKAKMEEDKAPGGLTVKELIQISENLALPELVGIYQGAAEGDEERCATANVTIAEWKAKADLYDETQKS